jgi:hypothetical protein
MRIAALTLAILPYLASAQEAPEISQQLINTCIEAPDFDTQVCERPEVQELVIQEGERRIVRIYQHLTSPVSVESMCAYGYQTYKTALWKECLEESLDALTAHQKDLKRFSPYTEELGGKDLEIMLDARIKYVEKALHTSFE